jgi:hypothetical protein
MLLKTANWCTKNLCLPEIFGLKLTAFLGLVRLRYVNLSAIAGRAHADCYISIC